MFSKKGVLIIQPLNICIFKSKSVAVLQERIVKLLTWIFYGNFIFYSWTWLYKLAIAGNFGIVANSSKRPARSTAPLAQSSNPAQLESKQLESKSSNHGNGTTYTCGVRSQCNASRASKSTRPCSYRHQLRQCVRGLYHVLQPEHPLRYGHDRAQKGLSGATKERRQFF